jgi:dolichol-phosphate mannosyltransferase
MNLFSERHLLSSSEAKRAAIADLVIVVPTLDERDNIVPLIETIDGALGDTRWEVIFVDDDSADGTIEVLETICKQDPRVRCLRRINRSGLASAVVEGIQSSFAPYIAVMDADLQHDPKLLLPMFEALRRDEADLVVGSRYIADGSVGRWDGRRHSMSLLATRLSRAVLKGYKVADPMSGFFMMKRRAFDRAVRFLSVQGYKILFDLIASSPTQLRLKEIPYTFGVRQHGESKLDSLVVLDYASLLLDKVVGRWIPVRFLLFSLTGASGVVLHMLVLGGALWAGASFVVAQSAGTISALVSNFFVNNALTYRDRRLKGFVPLLKGLLSFSLICSVGVVANVGIANALFVQNFTWWVSGFLGIMVGAVWNYAVSSYFTWRR